MDPEASAREDPIRAHRIKTLGIIGLRHVAKIDILGADPTPIATPAEEIEGILLAKLHYYDFLLFLTFFHLFISLFYIIYAIINRN